MSRLLDEEAAVRKVHKHLLDFGFVERDADGSDFSRPNDNTLRFKVGSCYGEVTITAWGIKEQIGVHRILRDGKVDEVADWIQSHTHDAIDIVAEGQIDPIRTIHVPGNS